MPNRDDSAWNFSALVLAGDWTECVSLEEIRRSASTRFLLTRKGLNAVAFGLADSAGIGLGR